VRVLWLVLVGISMLWLSITPSDGAEYHVNQDGTGDFLSIKVAVNVAATDGDTIIVHPGTYYENVDFWGPKVSLRSLDPDDPSIVEGTVIDGGWNDSVVTFNGNEDESCVLSGFTITNGRGHSGGGICGTKSVFNFRAFPRTKATVTNCGIVNNAANDGGGIAHCDGRIANCVIAGNSADLSCGGRGGGIYDCRAAITSCEIIDNFAGCGGGLADCSGTISLCTIIGNVGTPLGGGGASCCDGQIHGCVISNNHARGAGGGGLLSCGAAITSCTMWNNSADGDGASACECKGPISNCIIWRNNTGVEVGGDLDGCSTPSFSCILGWTGGGEGNISDDPVLAAPEDGDFRLSPGSPCIDAGSNWSVVGQTDFDGHPRIINGTVDMGAYEYPNGFYVKVQATREVYFAKEMLILNLEGGNFGPRVWVDLYAAIKAPYGPLLYLPTLGSEPQPWFQELSLPSGFHQEPFEAFSYVFSGMEPNGTYPIYYLFVPSVPVGSAISPGKSEFRYRRHRERALEVSQDGSADFLSIQEAIDAALEGETVVVHPGTYYENIQLRGCDITVQSLDPDDPAIVESTVIDGGGNGSVVRFSGLEDGSCVLSGFTIVNGKSFDGGGVHGADTLASVTNCRFLDNTATAWGGAIYECHGAIVNCVIMGNSAYEGAGLCSCYGLISNCLILHNTAGFQGGGMYDCGGRISSCTVSGNIAESYSGGGIGNCPASIVNCIVWGNDAPYWAPDLDDVGSCSYCLIGVWFEDRWNIVGEDPRFVTGPLGDWYLGRGSPCIDAGYGTAEDAGLSDRTTQADATPDTATVDIGYHYPICSGEEVGGCRH